MEQFQSQPSSDYDLIFLYMKHVNPTNCNDVMVSEVAETKLHMLLNTLDLYQFNYIESTTNKTLLMVAIDNEIDYAINTLLKFPYDCKMDYINHSNDGLTALMMACQKRMENFALHMLLYPHICALDQVTTNTLKSALYIACEQKLSYVALEILNYPLRSALNCPNDKNMTCLMVACEKTRNNPYYAYAKNVQMETVALKMLQFPTLCKIDHQNMYGLTALMYACKSRSEPVAMEILRKHRKSCALDAVDLISFTALMYACENLMETVVLEILKDPSDCNLYAKNEHGVLAKSMTHQLGLHRAFQKILRYNMTNNENDKNNEVVSVK